jgi:hypothetical protein
MKAIFLIILFLASSLLSCNKGPIFKSRVESSENKTTSFSPSNYDSLQSSNDGKYSYGVFNNESEAIVRLKIIDETTQKKMLLFGTTLWIDPTGSHKQKTGIKFPAAITPGDNYSLKNMGGKGKNFEANKRTLVDNAKLDADIIGFKSEKPIITDINVDDKGNLYYQIRIPFTEIYGDASSAKKMHPISIGIITDKPTMPEEESGFQGQRPYSGGAERGTRGSGGGGGMGRGGYGNSGGNRERPGGFQGERANGFKNMSEPLNYWFLVQFDRE